MSKLEPGFLTQKNVSYDLAENYISEFLASYYRHSSGEGGAYARKQMLSEINEYLAKLDVQGGFKKSKLLKWRVQSNFFAKNWQETIALIDSLGGCPEIDFPRKFHFYRAVSYWRLGELDKAHACFGELERAGITASENKFRMKLLKDRELNDFKRKLSNVQCSPDSFGINEFLVLIHSEYDLSYISDYRRVIDSIVNLLGRLRNKFGQTFDDVEWERVDPAISERLVFTCGFSWSGSGAVSDYFRDFREVSDASSGELSWLRGHSKLNATPLSQVLVDEKDISLDSFSDFFITSILGVPNSALLSSINFDSGYSIWEASVFHHFLSGNKLNEFLTSLEELESMLIEVKDGTDFAVAVSVFMATILLHLGSSRLVLCNNAVMAPHIKVSRFFRNSKFVVVTRDFGDQFCARAMESGSIKASDPNEFIELQKRSYARFNNSIDALDSVNNILVISFEDFVFDESLRTKVARFAGLDCNYSEARFSAQESCKNIGIANRYSQQECIRSVLEGLGDCLPHNKLR